MLIIGSPAWFHEKSLTEESVKLIEIIEERRQKFIARFSPEKLAAMDGSELLQNVFGNDPTSMMRLLMFDRDYYWFGGIGSYSYLGILYQVGDEWKFYTNRKSVPLTEDEAENQAVKLRDQIIFCVQTIEENMSIKTINDYRNIQSRIEKVYFYQYMWVLKYLQILLPQYFPGIYGDKAINRALKILGLPNHGNKFLNAGQISLFIRTCDVNSIVFGDIYGKQWGWDNNDVVPCPNAADNYKNSFKPVETVNLKYYNISTEPNRDKKWVDAIDNDIAALSLVGQERESFIKTRVNQSVYRKLLIERYQKCCICRISKPELLIASHIKPWAVSTPVEKLDPDNGFLLCPDHDKLFDLGFISCGHDGTILISSQLNGEDLTCLNLHPGMKIHVTEGNKKYLEYHRKHLFKE